MTRPIRATDYSGRLRFVWDASDAITADLRLSADRLETRAYYFVIPRDDESNPFTSFTTPPDANNTSSPIQVNNTGEDNRDMRDAALKLDFKTGSAGTFTSISAYDYTKEIAPAMPTTSGPGTPPSSTYYWAPTCNQSQSLTVKSYSQELRFTSNPVGDFSWIAGAYFVHTERFISTGNMVDTGDGVDPVYETPRSANPVAPTPSATFLADSRTTMPGRCSAMRPTSSPSSGSSMPRSATTRTRARTPPRRPTACCRWTLRRPFGAYRRGAQEHLDKAQPKGTLRYKPADNLTFYGGWSRGFRSGGFNQTGVGAVAQPVFRRLGVHDLFQAEIADTWEVGVKGEFLDRRLNVNRGGLSTPSRHNGYFFVFIAANSTQNLGNLDAKYKGAEISSSTPSPTDAARCCMPATATPTAGSRHGGPDGDRQPGAAGDARHHQRRRPVHAAAR